MGSHTRCADVHPQSPKKLTCPKALGKGIKLWDNGRENNSIDIVWLEIDHGAKTIIGKGIPEVEGTNAAHGEAGVPYQKTSRAHLGLPADELFYVSPETKSFFANKKVELKAKYAEMGMEYEEEKPVLSDQYFKV